MQNTPGWTLRPGVFVQDPTADRRSTGTQQRVPCPGGLANRFRIPQRIEGLRQLDHAARRGGLGEFQYPPSGSTVCRSIEGWLCRDDSDAFQYPPADRAWPAAAYARRAWGASQMDRAGQRLARGRAGGQARALVGLLTFPTESRSPRRLAAHARIPYYVAALASPRPVPAKQRVGTACVVERLRPIRGPGWHRPSRVH
jgi:hypothetical protein